MSDVVGRVALINRYPVKSMQGEQPDEVTFDAAGIVGDRRWGVRATGSPDAKVLSAKRDGRLLDASARSDGTDARPTITLPDGRVIEPGDPDTDAILSDWLGRDVELVEADADAGLAYEMSFNVNDEDDGVFEVPMASSRFVDLCPIHLITTASLATMAAAYPDGDWGPNRFRPAVLVETDPSITGLPENDWIGATLTVGGIAVTPTMPTIRCVMTTRPQQAHGLDRDLEIIRTVIRQNTGNLGLYGTVAGPGVVRVGDPVTLA